MIKRFLMFKERMFIKIKQNLVRGKLLTLTVKNLIIFRLEKLISLKENLFLIKIG